MTSTAPSTGTAPQRALDSFEEALRERLGERPMRSYKDYLAERAHVANGDWRIERTTKQPGDRELIGRGRVVPVQREASRG